MPLLRNALLMAGQGGVTRLSGFLTTVALSRILTPSDVGVYGLVVNTIGSVFGLARLGLDTALAVSAACGPGAADEREQRGRVLGAGLVLLSGLAVTAALGCMVLSPTIADFVFGRPEMAPWIAAAGALVVLSALTQFCYRTLLGFARFRQYARVMAVCAVGGMLLTAFGALLGGVMGAVVGLALAHALTLAGLHRATCRALREEGVQIRFESLRAGVRHLLRQGLPFYLAGLAIIPATYFVQGLLARQGGIEALGGLRVITSMLSLVTLVPVAVAPAILQRLAVAANGVGADLGSTSWRLLKYSWVFAVITGMSVDLLAPGLMTLFFGSDYARYVPVVSLALFSTMFIVVTGVVANILLATGRVALIPRYTLVQAIVFVSAAVVMLPEHGLVGYFMADICGRVAAFGSFLDAATVRNAMARQPWTRAAVLVSIIYAFVAWMSMTGAGGGRYLVASAGLVVACAVIFFFVLGRDERSRIILLFGMARGR